jgi:succinylglutamate desuccinylase
MKIQQSFSIVTKTAENPGNITTIMAGVHGNELAGVFAIQDLLAEQIQPIAGKIHFILANLKGLEIEQRAFEKNMNRCFREENNMESYEEQRVKEILPYLKESDFLLDVHNTLSEKNSIPLLISEYPEIDPYFNVDYTASGFDQLHPGGSDGYMNSV